MSEARTFKTGTADAVKEKESGRAPEGMAGLAKGLAVIEAFGESCRQLTVADAARATGVTRATARRCLLTLTDLGYVTYDGKYFRPTPRMLRLGTSYLESAPLPLLAQPHLIAAREELAESVSLAVLEDGWSMFVARAEAPRIVSTGVRLGARLPAYACATGRVLLTDLDEDALNAYLDKCRPERRTPKTLIDVSAIKVRVDEARVDAVAFTDEELELGMRSMATPVKNAQGRTIAALSVSVFTARATLEDMRRRFLPVLRGHADKIGRLL
jgi:IclR family pca regulon transcriptional regulator